MHNVLVFLSTKHVMNTEQSHEKARHENDTFVSVVVVKEDEIDVLLWSQTRTVSKQ